MIKIAERGSVLSVQHEKQPGYFLFMMRAPMTPGTQAQRVSRKTIRIDPQPLSITARGGKMIHNKTRQKDMIICDLRFNICDLRTFDL